MPIIKWGTRPAKKKDQAEIDRSVYVSDAKVDRQGAGWKKTSFWFRQEHLGKLKVIAHLKGSSTQDLINEALTEYIQNSFDNSMAMKKAVRQALKK